MTITLATINPRRLQLALAAALALAAFASGSSLAQTQLSPAMKAEAKSLAQLCRADFDKLCPGVRPGGGRVLTCLESHAVELTPQCHAALPQADALKAKAEAAGVLPK